MNGVHDMGGMHGFGPVVPEVNEPAFHAAWEGHVLALQRLTIGQDLFNLDAFRLGIEQMDPAHYLRSSYYERWLTTIETNLIEAGLLTRAELDAKTDLLRDQPDAVPTRPDSGPVVNHDAYGAQVHPLPDIAPRFAVGDAVLTRNIHPPGHTRIPRYVRAKPGVIHLIHGPEIFPDTNAHGQGEHPQPVYSVRFEAQDLWGASAEPLQSLFIDLWESYLEPAPE